MINYVWIKFKQHNKSIFSKAHIQLNNYLSTGLPNIDTLFTDPSCTKVADNFLNIICTQTTECIVEWIAEYIEQTKV